MTETPAEPVLHIRTDLEDAAGRAPIHQEAIEEALERHDRRTQRALIAALRFPFSWFSGGRR
jgi:hypothetical protein